MSKPLLSAAAAATFVIAGCTPPEPVPPPRFKPNPPYAPQPVDPSGQPGDPYGQTPQNPGATDPNATTPPPPAEPRPGDYPTATPSGRPNEVISPYEPREPIDVTGYSSGELVRDPRNRKIFRVP